MFVADSSSTAVAPASCSTRFNTGRRQRSDSIESPTRRARCVVFAYDSGKLSRNHGPSRCGGLPSPWTCRAIHADVEPDGEKHELSNDRHPRRSRRTQGGDPLHLRGPTGFRVHAEGRRSRRAPREHLAPAAYTPRAASRPRAVHGSGMASCIRSCRTTWRDREGDVVADGVTYARRGHSRSTFNDRRYRAVHPGWRGKRLRRISQRTLNGVPPTNPVSLDLRWSSREQCSPGERQRQCHPVDL